jgi:hypothetical protein
MAFKMKGFSGFSKSPLKESDPVERDPIDDINYIRNLKEQGFEGEGLVKKLDTPQRKYLYMKHWQKNR